MQSDDGEDKVMVTMWRTMVAALVLAVLATACAGGEAPLDADVLAVSAEGTIGEGSAAFTMVAENIGEIEGPLAALGAGGSRQEGVVDFASTRSVATMTVEGPAALLTGQRLEVRQIGNDVWGRYEGGLADTGPDRWVAFALSDEAAGLTGQAPAFQDPGTMLSTLAGQGVDLTEAGAEDLEGTATTRHEGTAPLQLLLEAGGQSMAEGFAQGFNGQVPGVAFDAEAFAPAFAAALEGRAGQLSLWVDDQGLARQVRMEYPLGDVMGAMVRAMGTAMGLPEDMADQALGAMAEVGDVQQVVTTTFSDFGVAVDVTAPPPEQVISMPEFQALIAETIESDPALQAQVEQLLLGQ